MPTPEDRRPNNDTDLDERLGEDEARRIDAVLLSRRPTIVGKKVSNMSPPKVFEGPSGVGDEEAGDETELTEEEDDRSSDDHWKLKEGIEGGPANPELLRSFIAHVAYAIWNGKERPVLKGINSFPKSIDRWMKSLVYVPKVATFVENSGLLDLKGFMFKHINMALISAFVERWHPETNSFHLPCGEVSLLLHDVHYLTNLTIVGKLVYDKMTVQTLKSKLASVLRVSPKIFQQNWKSGYVNFSLIKSRLKNGKGASDRVTKLYLMWLLTSTVFVDKTKSGVLADLFSFVDKLDEVSEYNWGAATLVNMYQQLGVASRSKSSSIAGYLSLLQAWIYTYFPRYRHGIKDGWTPEQPWMLKWEDKASESSGEALVAYRKTLDGLTEKDVDWTPCNPNPALEHPVSLFHGVLQFRHIKEPYMPDRFLRQFGYVQTIPSNPYLPVAKELRWKPNAYTCEYNIVPKIYEQSHMHSVRLDITRPVSRIGEAVEEYMEWFLERTHSQVQRELLSTTTDTNGDAVRTLERVADILRGAHPAVRGDTMNPHPCLDLIDVVCEELASSENIG